MINESRHKPREPYTSKADLAAFESCPSYHHEQEKMPEAADNNTLKSKERMKIKTIEHFRKANEYPFDAPTECTGLKEFGICEITSFEQLVAVNN